MNNNAPSKKTVLIVICTIHSPRKLWAKLLLLLKEDIELNQLYEVVYFPVNENLSMKEKGKTIWKLIGNYHGHSVSLLAHGLGSFLIFSSFYMALSDGHGNLCRNIKKVILFSPPTVDKKTIRSFRNKFKLTQYFILDLFGDKSYKVFKEIKSNYSEFVKIKKFIYERVVDAKENIEISCMIPICAIYGEKDIFVNYTSLRDFLSENAYKVDGNHYSVLQNIKKESNTWVLFKKSLLSPLGHKNIVKIERFALEVSIKPMPLMVKEVGKDNKIIEEHNAELRYNINFSKNNISKNRFKIKFSVQNNGYIRETYLNYKNEIEPPNRGRFDRRGDVYECQMNPREKIETYKTIIEISNGFSDAQFWENSFSDTSESEPKNRESNYYLPLILGKGEYSFQEIIINLDLSKFINSKFIIDDINAYWLPQEISTIQKFDLLIRNTQHYAVDLRSYIKELSNGRYAVEIENIDYGTILITWKVNNC